MGLNICAGFGIFLSVAAVILLVFGEIGQITSSTIPRHLRIVSVSTTGLGAAISAASGASGNTTAIYNTGTAYSVKTNGTHDGLRQVYEWGFWNYCATDGAIGSTRSYCTKRAFGSRFQPAAVLEGDVPTNYVTALNEAVPSGTFTADGYLGKFTHVATYMVFVGAILAALAMLIGFAAHRFAFFAGAIFALLGFLSLAVGLVIYTILISRVKSAINGAKVGGTTPLGIQVSYGTGLWLCWGATGALFLAIVPYLVSCCVGRGNSHEHEEKDNYYNNQEQY